MTNVIPSIIGDPKYFTHNLNFIYSYMVIANFPPIQAEKYHLIVTCGQRMLKSNIKT